MGGSENSNQLFRALYLILTIIYAPTVDAHTSECPPMAHAARDRGGWGHYPLYLRHARSQCQRWTRRGILEQLSNIVQ